MESVLSRPDNKTGFNSQLGNLSFNIKSHHVGLRIEDLKIKDALGPRKINYLSKIPVFRAFSVEEVEGNIYLFGEEGHEVGQIVMDVDPLTNLVTNLVIYEDFGRKPNEDPYISLNIQYDEQGRIATIIYSQWMELRKNFGYVTNYTNYNYGNFNNGGSNIYREDYKSTQAGSDQLQFVRATLGVFDTTGRYVKTIDYQVGNACPESSTLHIFIPEKQKRGIGAWFDTFYVLSVDKYITLVD